MRRTILAAALVAAGCTEEADFVRISSPCELRADDGTTSTAAFGETHHVRRRTFGEWHVVANGVDRGVPAQPCVGTAGASTPAIVADPTVALRDDPEDASSHVAELPVGTIVGLVGEGPMPVVLQDGLPRGHAPRTSFASPADAASLAKVLENRAKENLPWTVESIVRLPAPLRGSPELLALVKSWAPRLEVAGDVPQLRRAYMAFAPEALEKPELRDLLCRSVYGGTDDAREARWKFAATCGRVDRLRDVAGKRELTAFGAKRCADGANPLLEADNPFEAAWLCRTGAREGTVFVSDHADVAVLARIPLGKEGDPCGPVVRELEAGGFGACLQVADRDEFTCQNDQRKPAVALRCFTLATTGAAATLQRDLEVPFTDLIEREDCEPGEKCPPMRLPTVRVEGTPAFEPGPHAGVVCLWKEEDFEKSPREAWRLAPGKVEKVADVAACKHPASLVW